MQVADLLLSAGADANSLDPNRGMTALHRAAQNGLEEMVRKLFARGAVVAASFGQPPMTPLSLAFRRGHWSIVRLLLEAGADPNGVIASPTDPADPQGITLVQYVASVGDAETLRLLIGRRADLNLAKDDGMTPLMMAAFNGHAEAVRLLVEAGATVNAIASPGGNPPLTAFDAAAAKGHDKIVAYLRSQGGVSRQTAGR